jgi:hypothetical protein
MDSVCCAGSIASRSPTSGSSSSPMSHYRSRPMCRALHPLPKVWSRAPRSDWTHATAPFKPSPSSLFSLVVTSSMTRSHRVEQRQGRSALRPTSSLPSLPCVHVALPKTGHRLSLRTRCVLAVLGNPATCFLTTRSPRSRASSPAKPPWPPMPMSPASPLVR